MEQPTPPEPSMHHGLSTPVQSADEWVRRLAVSPAQSCPRLTTHLAIDEDASLLLEPPYC